MFEDLCPVLGFVLLPHLNWDQKDIDGLHLVAIVRKTGIKTLRDLTSEQLPLLRNIKISVLVSFMILYFIIKLLYYFFT